MDSFLTTLATTVGTLLGILLAAITAYFVFLRERVADYSDRISEEQLEIREKLLPLRKLRWLSTFVSPEFIRRYSATYPTKTKAELFKLLASQLFTFGGSRIEDKFSELDESYRGQPWKGRLYYVLLQLAADVMAPQFDSWRPKQKTFPSEGVDIGFDKWRTEFEKMDQSIQDASLRRQGMIEDFAKFNFGRHQNPAQQQLEERYMSTVDGFFAAVDGIRASLNRIDMLASVQNKYKSSKLHTSSLSVLCFLSFVFGVLVPLVMLILHSNLSAKQAVALMFVVLVTTFLSFFAFGKDVFRADEPRQKSYLNQHWAEPMLYEMESQKPKFNLRGLLDPAFFREAKNSGDFKEGILLELDSYLVAMEEYNEAVRRFDDTVLNLFRNKALGPDVSQGGFGFCPYDMLDRNKIIQTVEKLYQKSGLGLSISTFDFQGITTGPPKFRVSAGGFDKEQLLEVLMAIHNFLSNSSVVHELERKHQALVETESKLEKHLRRL